MPAVIEFVHDWFAEVESAPGRLRQVAFRRGAMVHAEIRPLDSGKRAAPSANLRLADGTTVLDVPLSCISVVGDRARAG